MNAASPVLRCWRKPRIFRARCRLLREIFPASDHGTSLSDLSVILQQIGIATAPVLFDHAELHALPFPSILHYGASHYVLLAWRKGDYVCVMNPAIGQQWLPFSGIKKRD